MKRSRLFFAASLVLSLLVLALGAGHAQSPAPTPPMGWNSWDSYGFTIDENDFKANVTVLASMKQYGWQYAVIDEGWYMQNPFGDKLETRKYLWNENGLLIPVAARFPDAANGAGFKPLADWIHQQGLKFGIHIVRGIPKQVVDQNLPIGGSSFHAIDAADKGDSCPWDDANYGIQDNAAGQAYYDSMLKLYAAWGLDFLKVDCISDHPYRVSEIKQIAAAIQKTGRPIVLSLSPGPTQLEHAAEVAKYAEMWRISNDHWDAWLFEHHTDDGYPFGLRNAFDMIEKWNPYLQPGHWPDADMLPEGYLGPKPGDGAARQSRLTPDEQRSEFTLWAFARSPMIFGGNLIRLDAFNKALMTNQELLEINQKAFESHPVKNLPAGFDNVRVWLAKTGVKIGVHDDIALFNLNDQPVTLHFTLRQLGARQAIGKELFTGKTVKVDEQIELTLPAHGSTVYRISPQH
jgi:hypothetical protein